MYVYGQIYEVEYTVNKRDLCVYVYGQIYEVEHVYGQI